MVRIGCTPRTARRPVSSRARVIQRKPAAESQGIPRAPATRTQFAAEAVEQHVQAARSRRFLKRVVEVVARSPRERRFKTAEVLYVVERPPAWGGNVLRTHIGPGAEFVDKFSLVG